MTYSEHLQEKKLFFLLPREIALIPFSYLDPCTLAKTAQVCKAFQILSYENTLWKALCTKTSFDVPSQVSDWKKFFIKKYEISKNIKNGEFSVYKIDKRHVLIRNLCRLGTKIAASSKEQIVILDSQNSWKEVTVLSPPEQGLHHLVEMNGQLIYAGILGKIRVWDPQRNWEIVKDYTAEATVIMAIAARKDQLALSLPTSIQIHESLAFQKPLVSLSHSKSPASVLLFMNNYLYSAHGSEICIWEPDSHPKNPLKILSQHKANVSSMIQFKNYLISGAQNGEIKIWDPQQEWSCIKTLQHKTDIGSPLLFLEKMDSLLFSSSNTGSLSVFDSQNAWNQISSITDFETRLNNQKHTSLRDEGIFSYCTLDQLLIKSEFQFSSSITIYNFALNKKQKQLLKIIEHLTNAYLSKGLEQNKHLMAAEEAFSKLDAEDREKLLARDKENKNDFTLDGLIKWLNHYVNEFR